MRDRAPALLQATYGDAFGYIRQEGRLKYRECAPGDSAVFWNGTAMEIAPYSEFDYWVGDYVSFAHQIIDLAAGRDMLVLDVGAGTCIQAIALRAENCDLPVLNLDFFGMAIGQRLIDSLELRGMFYGHVDINAALSQPESAEKLRRTILDVADGRPILIVSRYAISGFYTELEYQRLFRFILDDLQAAAGIHLEFCGHNTETFKAMRVLWPSDFVVAPKCLSAEGNSLGYLAALPSIRVVSREEVWPHQLTTRFPSFLSWDRK